MLEAPCPVERVSARYTITLSTTYFQWLRVPRACGGNDGRVDGRTFSVITSRLPTIQEDATASQIR